ncbi:MAG: class II glutamine amidotransferase [Elusimicrobia bacterium]|nr:class II glutamine amidotransferase [Elusimicrobiota bacterium]
MCRMLGVVSKNISPLWLESFYGLMDNGKHGDDTSKGYIDKWGICGYLGNWTVHFGRSKDNAIPDYKNFDDASQKAVISGTEILISHLTGISNKKSKKIKVENTHSFICDDWIFCHNGTIYNSERLLLPEYEYEGTTDSERFFKFLINRLNESDIEKYQKTIKDAVREIKEKCLFTSLTFILSNGEYLIAYRDFCREDDYYTLYYYHQNDRFLVCSEKLPGFEWKKIKNGEIIVVDKYKIVDGI